MPDYSIEFARVVAASCGQVLLCISDRYFSPDRSRSSPNLQINWLAWPRQREFGRSVLFMKGLARIIRQWNPDVVHLLMADNVWTILLRALLRPIPLLTTVHDVRLHSGDIATARVPRVLVRCLARRSSAILVHGEGLRAEASDAFSIELDRIFAFPHPPLVDYLRIAQAGRLKKTSDETFRILFFGRVLQYKGLKYLLEAVPVLARSIRDLKIIIAGAGDDLQQYADFISQNACIEVYDGYIPASEVARLFTDADVLVLPYIEASQSGVLMIAMSFGLPVVATEVGEIANTVRSTAMGLLTEPRDAAALAARLVDIASDKALRRRLSSNARCAMRGLYSREALSQRALAVYRQLLEMRR
jgi:glycosyltransferase involved in cell wall biosynthesis